MSNIEEWTPNLEQNNELPNNQKSSQEIEENEQREQREQRNLKMMEQLKAVPEYEGVLHSSILENGDEVLVFERVAYISGFENPVIGKGEKAEKLRRNNHTINTNPETLLQDDDSIHVFSKYGLTTFTGIVHDPRRIFNSGSLGRFEKKILPIIQNHRDDGYSRLNYALPLNYRDLDHFLKFWTKKGSNGQSGNDRLFATFHIFNGLFTEEAPSFLPLLGKRLEEASKEKKRREEEIDWEEVRARQEKAKREREERERMKTPEGVLERMREGKPQIKTEEQTNIEV